MESRRIASTPLGGLKVLGRAADRDHTRLVTYLAAHPELGAGAAHLFAEPVPTRDGSRIDWYVGGAGRAVPLEEMEATRQPAVLQRVGELLSAIRSEGERLHAAGDPMGTVLLGAAQTPEPLSRYVYVNSPDGGGDEQPVIVCWSHTDDLARTAGAAPQVMVPGTPPPREEAAAQFVSVPAAPVIVQHRVRWWWPLWLLLALLLLTIAWLLLRACGLTAPFSWSGWQGWQYCRAGASALVVETERGRVLEDVAQRLELDLLKAKTACAAAAPAPLPKDRWVQKDLSLLAGCWTLGKDTQSLIVDDTGKQQTCTVHAGKICFGSDGKGTREQTTDCGAKRFSVCKSPVTAHFNDAGALETDQPDTKCDPPSITWHGGPNKLICKRRDDSGALCRDADNFEHEFHPKANP